MEIKGEAVRRQRPKRTRAVAVEGPIRALPTDAVVEVFMRLPVDSLVRCRSVCKSWHSLILDPQFVKSHFKSLTRSDDYVHHKLIYSETFMGNMKVCSVPKLLYNKPLDTCEIVCYTGRGRTSNTIFGSCNGLILLCVYTNVGPVTMWNHSSIGSLTIWNPATKQWRTLLNSGRKLSPDVVICTSYGFGYLEATGEFKIVEIISVGKDQCAKSNRVKVYLTKTRRWKRIDGLPNRFCFRESGVFLNGRLYWLAVDYHLRKFKIFSMDLVNETFNEVMPPEMDKYDYRVPFGVLGDCLSVITFDGPDAYLWIQKVYGAEESWTKLASIPYKTHHAYDISVPMAITNDGKFLLLAKRKLVLYDPKNGTLSKTQNHDSPCDWTTYVESLVSPDAVVGRMRPSKLSRERKRKQG